jgi:hypothetical protein
LRAEAAAVVFDNFQLFKRERKKREKEKDLFLVLAFLSVTGYSVSAVPNKKIK